MMGCSAKSREGTRSMFHTKQTHNSKLHITNTLLRLIPEAAPQSCETVLNPYISSYTTKLNKCPLINLTHLRTGDADLRFLHYNCARRMKQICVFNTRLFSLHSTLNYAIHRACLRMVLLTDVYRNLTSL